MMNFFKKNWYLLSILIIILFAGGIRLYKLGEVPHGMTWDEAAIGYNGYAIIHTRRDEWLEKLPVSFKSFGDFKAPLAIYINGAFTLLFGMSLFAVRLPFFMFSILAIVGIILLTAEIFRSHRFKEYYVLFAGFVMAISPWHFHYSRVGLESGMALSFVIWGILFIFISLRHKFEKQIFSFASILAFSAAIYTYHSSKITIPLLGIVFFIVFYKEIVTKIKKLVFPLVVFILTLIPFISDSIFGDGLTRAGVTIFSSDQSLTEKIAYVVKSFLLHISPNFLLLGETTTLRHGTGYLGVLFITTLVLVVFGVIALFKKVRKSSYFKFQVLFVCLIVFGILPAAIALEVPHSNRALLSLLGFIVTALFGLDYVIEYLQKTKINEQVLGTHNETNIIVKSVVGTLIAIHVIFSVSFLNNYFSEFSIKSTNAFTDGYLEAFVIAQKYETGNGVEEVDKILFTSDYGQPYIYALFSRKTNPIWYQGGSLIKYEFTDAISEGDLFRNNALIVGSGADILPTQKADHIIYGQDGSIRFQIFKTKKINK